MTQEVNCWQAPTEGGPQAVVTITVAGSDCRIVRRGAFEELIGERSLDLILATCLDTGYLNQILLAGLDGYQEERRAAEEIASVLTRDHRLSVRRGGGDTAAARAMDIPVYAPSDQKGVDLATRVDQGTEAGPWYSLHVHVAPAPSRPSVEQSFEERVEIFKRKLRPRVEVLDLRGLFRGNMQALGEAFHASQQGKPPAGASGS